MLKASFLYGLIVFLFGITVFHMGYVRNYEGYILTANFLGLSGFVMIAVSLMLGPLMVIDPKRFASLIEARRSIGVAGFFFLLFHYLVVLTKYYSLDMEAIFRDPSKLFGSIALWIFSILALTSTDLAVKYLTPVKWKNLQRLIYIAFPFSFIHFILELDDSYFSQKPLDLENIFYHLPELFAILLGFVTIALQLAGFYIVRNKKKR